MAKRPTAAPVVEAPAPPTPTTFTDAEVKTMDLFAALVQENMRTVAGLSLAQILQMAQTLQGINALRNKINDNVLEFLGKDGPR